MREEERGVTARNNAAASADPSAEVLAPVPFPEALERFPRVRQSLAGTFQNCPLQAKFDIEHRTGWNSHPAGRGTLTHRAIAKAIDLMVEQHEPYCPPDVALDLLDEVQRQHDVPMIATAESMSDSVVVVPLRELAEARVTVRTWAMHFRVDPEVLVGAERRFETTLTYPDGAGGRVERIVTGQVDALLIDGTTAIVKDWKDTWGIPAEKAGRVQIDDDGPPSGDNVSVEGYFQQRRYGLLILRNLPRIERVILEEVYPRYLSGEVLDRRGDPINPIRRAVVTRADLPEIEREMSALVEQLDRSVETGVWKPSPGTHCRWCCRPSQCTIPAEVRDDGMCETLEDARRLGGAQQVLRRRQTMITRALKSWSDANGSATIEIADPKTTKVYGPVVRTETTKPDAAQVKDAFERGIDPSTLFSTREKVVFCLHRPEEVHPHEQAVRDEERLLAAEKAGDA